MKALEDIFREMDFEFFGFGQHTINLNNAVQMVDQKDKAIFLDIRTDEERKYLSFNFAYPIPVHELPDRIHELPKDKLIIIFCSSVVRSGIVYPYLLAQGFEKVKILVAKIEELAGAFKPGKIYSRLK
ncbi:MAG: rhodanese-like domain-containing protein [Desulfonauticus sp.]|nr:rhodanese-like domain-containing protein [Desulfonauticus sp.]